MADWWNVFIAIALVSVFGWAAWMAASDQASHIAEGRMFIKYWPGGWFVFVVIVSIANAVHNRPRRRTRNGIRLDEQPFHSPPRMPTRDQLTPTPEDREREEKIDDILRRDDFR